MIKVGGRWLFGFLSKKERGDSIDKKYWQQVQFLVKGMFATVVISGTAYAEWQVTLEGSWIYKEYIPKASVV